MDYDIYRVKVVFKEPILGSQSSKETMGDWVHPQMPDDERESLPERLEKGTTVFHRFDNKPALVNYQVKGFLKNAASVLNGLKIYQTKALKSKVEDHVFITPRFILLHVPNGEEIAYLERPLSAMTAQGPRIAIARSEMLPAKTWIEFTVEIIHGSPIDKDLLSAMLEYGNKIGLSQWRNAEYGSFTFEYLE